MVWYGMVWYGMVWYGNQGGAGSNPLRLVWSSLAWHGFLHLVKCNKMAEKAVKKMGRNLGNSMIKKICSNSEVSSTKTKRRTFNESDQVLSKLVLDRNGEEFKLGVATIYMRLKNWPGRDQEV